MELPELETLDLEPEDGWLTVWFNSPENRNALSTARVEDILTLCDVLGQSPAVRGVTFRGRGEVFCAGGDLRAFSEAYHGGVGDRDDIVAASLRAAEMFDALSGLPQYTVMAVEWAAMAGGMGLVCCGDYVIAAEDALFGLSEVRIGLTPAQIAPFVLRRLGMREGRRLMLTGARLSGEEALRIGLADELVAGGEAMDAAINEQRKLIAGVAPAALAAVKAQVGALPFQPREAQKRSAAESFAERMMSEEAREGIAAFFEKRKPRWTGN